MPGRKWVEREAISMKQEDAKEAILREFHKLPESKRNSGADRVEFAMEMIQKYRFKCSGDPYEAIKGWLIREMPEENW